MNYIITLICHIIYSSPLLSPPSPFPSFHCILSLNQFQPQRIPKLDNEFEDKLQQLLTVGILEVWS